MHFIQFVRSYCNIHEFKLHVPAGACIPVASASLVLRSQPLPVQATGGAGGMAMQ